MFGMKAISRLSLVHRFLLVGFFVLVAAMVFIGTWVGTQIQSGIMNGMGVMTDLYLDGAISPHLQSLASGRPLEAADRIALDRKLASTHLGQHIVVLKIWGLDGRIIFNSADPSLAIGSGPAGRPPASAFAGEVSSRIVNPSELGSAFKERQQTRLIETYSPIRADRDRSVIAVADFYQSAVGMEQAVRQAQLRSWVVHGAVTLAMLALLATLVRRATDTIAAQQRELGEKVEQLTALLTQNEQLHERVRRAGARTTALNERFLRHVATDLHDGPGQGLALASMRIESLAEVCSACAHASGHSSTIADDFNTIHVALQSALTDMRAILRGLQLPEIEQLSVADTARRAVRDHERKTGRTVLLAIGNVPDEAPLSVRIALFRLLQESLANGFRHGGSGEQQVTLDVVDGQFVVDVSDAGKGFDPKASIDGGHLGLQGMRERVELLGGRFEVQSSPDHGTVVRATLPLAQQAHENG
jgi:signal transduction histidine kinase